MGKVHFDLTDKCKIKNPEKQSTRDELPSGDRGAAWGLGAGTR